MKKTVKFRTESNQKNPKSNSKRLNWKIIAVALYVTFLFLSTIAFTAERNIETKMQESYTYHLRYPVDGRQTHYYVERENTSKIGKIDLTYTTKTNILDVNCYNIKVLHIFCRSMYEDECKEVYGFDPSDNSNYYKWYFIEKNHFHVNIESDSVIEDLEFIDTPLAYEVIVDDQKWYEGTDYFYKANGALALSYVPSGTTHVDLYFKPRTSIPPMAILEASKTVVPVDYTINFSASKSFDPDGSISAYILDLGDGTYKGGENNYHSYSEPGIYGVILTVRDNNDLLARDYLNITVVKSSNIPEIQSIIPNQERSEDSPPWILNLTLYEPIASSSDIEFNWYLTGEDESLYTVTGENGTDSRIFFMPVANAFGSDLATIWLYNSDNMSDSQQIWINITPVNDPPVIQSPPDLVVLYDEPYTFNYLPYVDDIETPKRQLLLNIFDGFDKKYITINGLNATYNYPHDMVGKIVYATIMVSDGDEMGQDVISIQVTSDHVPRRVKELPDIWLYEGTTKYNVFDLDDYFTDPDNDAIYFSYGFTHLEISIHLDHTVDISAASEWTGSELVTFRASDPIGALAEDSIIVTVLPVNDPPTIEDVPDFFIRYGVDYRFDLTPYVQDNDNTTDELKITVSDPQHIRLDIRNNMVIILNYPVSDLGRTKSLRLTVTDGLDSSFQDVSVTITEDFPPELITPLPDFVFLEDEPLNNAIDLDRYFMDADGDVLFYTTGNVNIKIAIYNDHTVDLSAPPDWFGSESVYFRATDPTGALQEDRVLITVLPVNDAPILLPIPLQLGNESERWVLDLEPYISDVDNNISELEISVDSDSVVVSGYTLIFLGSSELPKQVEVTVSDGEYTAAQTVEIRLNLDDRPKTPTLFDLFINILPYILIILIIMFVIIGVVYRKMGQFTAEEVFLIHSNSTLITHLSRNPQANVDDVIFSGMFNAVQEFIKDSFSSSADQDKEMKDSKWALDELKLGDNNILIERSDFAYLAVIFSGVGSKRLRRIVARLLHKIENKYANILPKWNGNKDELKGTKEILSVLIKPIEVKPVEPKTILVTTFDNNKSLLKETIIKQPPGNASSEPVVTKPLGWAQPAQQSNRSMFESKELLNSVGDQTGVGKPGLTAWSITNRREKELSKNKMENLPSAIHINPKQHVPKTIIIKNDKIMIGNQDNSKGGAGAINTKPVQSSYDTKKHQSTKPISIAIPGKDKKFKIDPNKPLLQQLADSDNKE